VATEAPEAAVVERAIFSLVVQAVPMVVVAVALNGRNGCLLTWDMILELQAVLEVMVL
jgi:hypothetical protein